MKIFKSFKSMQTGFGLLLLISLFASFVDLSNTDAAYNFWGFYALVILFVMNLSIYVVNKLKRIIQILKMGTESRRTLHTGLGLQLSLFAVHAGIALLFLGNMLDLSLGYNQRVELKPGDSFTLPASEMILKLEEFIIDYYQDGSPSQYTSKVLVTEKDKEERSEITVNHPLEISGSKMYQESYGWSLNIEIGNGDKSKKYLVNTGEEVGLGDNKIEIIQYVPNFVPGKIREQGVSGKPAVIYFSPAKNLTGAAVLGEKVKISEKEYLIFTDKQAFTVLKVKTSPGMPFVGLGAALLVIGIVFVFLFMKKKSIGLKNVCKDVSKQ